MKKQKNKKQTFDNRNVKTLFSLATTNNYKDKAGEWKEVTDRTFFNTNVKDPRLNDPGLIGEIIDMPLDDIVASFAKDEKII